MCRFAFLSFIILLSSNALGQKVFIVDSVTITGNEKTKPFIIQRELVFNHNISPK